MWTTSHAIPGFFQHSGEVADPRSQAIGTVSLAAVRYTALDFDGALGSALSPFACQCFFLSSLAPPYKVHSVLKVGKKKRKHMAGFEPVSFTLEGVEGIQSAVSAPFYPYDYAARGAAELAAAMIVA